MQTLFQSREKRFLQNYYDHRAGEQEQEQEPQFETDKVHNTHLLCQGKYRCMDDLLFGWFGIHQTSRSVVNSI